MQDFIAHYRRAGQVLDIHAEVDPEFEVAAIAAEAQDRNNAIVVFHNVRGHDMPVVLNLYASRDRLADILGVRRDGEDSIARALNRHIEESQASTEPTLLPGNTNDRVAGSLGQIPLLRYHEEDVGRYLTAGIFLVRDPDTGVANLSFHRGLYVNDQELRISIGPRHDLGAIQAAAEARGEVVHAAAMLSVSPALFVAACTSIPTTADELALAASIAGGPLPTAPARTFDMEIPLAADIVIEGRILPGERRPEAPFGEWMGYYIEEKQSHVFAVDHVEWRPHALAHGLICGSGEDLRPLEASTAARIYKTLAQQFAGIVDVVCYPTMLCTVVQVRPQYEGHARQVLMAAVTAHFLYSKLCIVVDDDVDPYSLDDVIWAFVTRARPDERTQILGNLPGFFRDPHKDHWGRLALDATMPWGREHEFRRKRIPGRNHVRLDDLLSVQPE